MHDSCKVLICENPKAPQCRLDWDTNIARKWKMLPLTELKPKELHTKRLQ